MCGSARNWVSALGNCGAGVTSYHMLFLDGVYSSTEHPKWFRQVKAPSSAELTRLTHTIAQRVGRYLERQGLVERDTGNIFLVQDAGVSDEDPSNQLFGSSI